MRLFEPERHDTLSDVDWNAQRARDALEQIVADAHREFTPENLWRIHPFDVSPERPACLKTLYYGAAGVIWTLDYLERQGAVSPGPNYLATVGELCARHRADLRQAAAIGDYLGSGLATYLTGELGMLLLHWKLQPSEALCQEIQRALRVTLGDTRGLLWGAAGSMLVALFMHERTGEPRWRDLFIEHLEALWRHWAWSDELQCWVWTSELYGVTETRLGGLHGFVGNAHAIARGADLLPAAQRDEVFTRISQTLARTASIDGDCANWPHNVGASNRPLPMPWLVQFCSGAPGVIACLSAFTQPGAQALTEALLLQAGELVWRAGPTRKFPVLCHGAAGAGYAMLKLYACTRDERWLTRARAFAMYGIDRSELALREYGQRKFALWTGDLGLAVFLWDCLRAIPSFPTLDVF